MAHFIMLMKVTDKGAADVDELAGYMKAITDSWGVLRGASEIYATMGEYDLVLHGEASNDEDVAWLAAQIARDGKAKPVTMRAFTEDEVRAIIEHPPAEPLHIVGH